MLTTPGLAHPILAIPPLELEGQFDWFRLEADVYVPVLPDAEGIIRSRVFPGLWLAVPALLTGEMITVLRVLQEGLNSAEHQAFQPVTAN